MSNQHDQKFISRTFLGLVFITGGVFAICYSGIAKDNHDDWFFWAIIAAVAINAGLLFMGSGIIHKIKSDLIRRQRIREQHKTFHND